MTPQGRVSPVATQRDGDGEGSTLCIFAKSETSSVSRRKHSRALVTQQLPQEENSSSWAVGALVFVSFQDCTLQPLVASVWSVALNQFFFQEVRGRFYSCIKAYLMHCLCKEINCRFPASFTETLPKCYPIHSQILHSGKDWCK